MRGLSRAVLVVSICFAGSVFGAEDLATARVNRMLKDAEDPVHALSTCEGLISLIKSQALKVPAEMRVENEILEHGAHTEKYQSLIIGLHNVFSAMTDPALLVLSAQLARKETCSSSGADRFFKDFPTADSAGARAVQQHACELFSELFFTGYQFGLLGHLLNDLPVTPVRLTAHTEDLISNEALDRVVSRVRHLIKTARHRKVLRDMYLAHLNGELTFDVQVMTRYFDECRHFGISAQEAARLPENLRRDRLSSNDHLAVLLFVHALVDAGARLADGMGQHGFAVNPVTRHFIFYREAVLRALWTKYDDEPIDSLTDRLSIVDHIYFGNDVITRPGDLRTRMHTRARALLSPLREDLASLKRDVAAKAAAEQAEKVAAEKAAMDEERKRARESTQARLVEDRASSAPARREPPTPKPARRERSTPPRAPAGNASAPLATPSPKPNVPTIPSDLIDRKLTEEMKRLEAGIPMQESLLRFTRSYARPTPIAKLEAGVTYKFWLKKDLSEGALEIVFTTETVKWFQTFPNSAQDMIVDLFRGKARAFGESGLKPYKDQAFETYVIKGTDADRGLVLFHNGKYQVIEVCPKKNVVERLKLLKPRY